MTLGDSRGAGRSIIDVDVQQDRCLDSISASAGASTRSEGYDLEATKSASSSMKTEKEDVANGVRRSIAFAALIRSDEVGRNPAEVFH